MNTLTKATVYTAVALLFSVAACGDGSSPSNTRVVIDIDRSIEKSSGVLLSIGLGTAPDQIKQDDPGPYGPDSRYLYTLVSLSDEAGPMFDLIVDGYAAEEWPSSEAEAFWGTKPQAQTAVARVGVRSGFVTGETRFITMRPTYGCLESTDSIPEREPGSLGREGQPLVLDGCTDQGDSTDADAGI